MTLVEIGDIFAVIGAVLAGSLLATLIRTQFRLRLTDDLRGALTSAHAEIKILKAHGERLEAQLFECSNRVSVVEGENTVLSQTIQTGIKLAPAFEAMLRAETVNTAAALETRTQELADALAKVAAERAVQQDALFHALSEDIAHTALSTQGQVLRCHRVIVELIKRNHRILKNGSDGTPEQEGSK